MSKPKFTPGPWRIEQPWAGYSSLRDSRDDIIFSLAAPANDASQIEANAHLIATAPEMYDALESNGIVLAAAHGRALASLPSLHRATVDQCDCLIGKAYRTAMAALKKAEGAVQG